VGERERGGSGGGERERKEGRRVVRRACGRIDIGSFQAGRYETLFASSQSNE
jgi:hypothetical protein